MTAFPSYSTGTVSVANGATVIVGNSTIWSGVNARPGDDIVIDGHMVVVQDVTDVTHLVIDPWPYTSVAAGAAYKIIQRSPLRFVGGQAMADVSKMVAALNTDGFYVFVAPDLTAPDPSLGEENQFALQPDTGKLWLKTGGVWVFQGIYKGFSIKGPWSAATAYQVGDVVSLDGSSYVALAASTNQTPPNATYWQVLAAKGDTGDTGPQGAGYGGTSTTSLAIGTGSKTFALAAGFAYQAGNYVRASSAANGANFMEGAVTAYSGGNITVNVTKTGGSGTFADWRFAVSGAPGSGDMLSTNNLSDVSDKNTARVNLMIPDMIGAAFPMYNGKIVESHTGNAATFAIKTNAGSDPSVVDPVKIGFFTASGLYVERSVTAATSVTVSSGSTLGMSPTTRFELVIVALDDDGTVKLAVASRLGQTLPAGSNAIAFALDEGTPQSTTAEGGAGGADSGATLYSQSTITSKQARIVARAEYDNGLATAGTWNVSPSRILLEHRGTKKTALPPAFYAHKNNVTQPLFDGIYTKLTFTTARFNIGGYYDTVNSRWTPPAGLVELSAAVWLNAGIDPAPTNVTAKIWKNGQATEVSAGVGWAPAGFAGTGGTFIPRTIDLANGTDYYELFIFVDNTANTNIGVADGNPAHTWFCGNVIG
ncbi:MULTISPECIES: hypothetical protein [unclassified Bradyrhizobium]